MASADFQCSRRTLLASFVRQKTFIPYMLRLVQFRQPQKIANRKKPPKRVLIICSFYYQQALNGITAYGDFPRARPGIADLVDAGAQPAMGRIGVKTRMPEHGDSDRLALERQFK